MKCEHCNRDWGISDPNTGRHWLQAINYCPICGAPVECPITFKKLLKLDGERVRVRAVHDGDLDVYPDCRCTVRVNDKSVGRHGEDTYGFFEDYGIEWLAYQIKPE